MKILFHPAIALMNRLGYTRKFALLGGLFLIAITVLTYSLYVSLSSIIHASQRELTSIALIEPISRTIRNLQLSRGLNAAVLGGNVSLHDRLAAKEKKVTESLAALEQQLPANLKTSKDWLDIETNWLALQHDSPSLSTTENYTRHTRLIQQLLHFEIVQAWDTKADIFHLVDLTTHRLPDVIEHMGRLRAYGTHILAQERISEPQKLTLYGKIANLEDTLPPLQISFDQAAEHIPELQGMLGAASSDIVDSVQQVIDLVKTDILTGRLTTTPEDFLMMVTAVIDDHYAQLYASLLPSAENQIQKRISDAENALRTSIGVAFLLFLVVIYFWIGGYYATVGSIRSLARSARAFSAGDLNARIDLGTHDELRQVQESFNEMASEFGAMLAKQEQSRQLLRERADEIEDLYNHAPCGYHSLDQDGVIVSINNTELAWLGYTRDEVVGKMKWFDLLAPEGASVCDTAFLKLMQHGSSQNQEVMMKRKDGTSFIGLVNASAVYDASGNFQRSRSMMLDITARKHAEEELQLKALLLDSSNDSVFVLDLNGNFVYLNKAAWESRGYTCDEMMKMDLRTLDTPEYAEFVETRFGEITKNGQHTFESAHRRKDGSVMPIEVSARLVETGGSKLICSMIRDITARKRAEEKMRYLANYDTLTGLPNRTLFHDRLAQEIKKAHRAGLKLALLYIDLDRFKEVNDTLGHNIGDLLLVEAARRISDCVREADTVARLSGDEFVVILTELSDAGSTERVADTILQTLAEPFDLEKETAFISASIGITLYPDDATGVDELLKDADQAMYVAKHTGRNRLSFFTPALEHAAQSRLHLLNDLRGALANQQLRVHYQPIVNLATGRIEKAEALIRWHHPERGTVSPADFIPLAEESGLIVDIGDWVFRQAAQQAKHWRTLYNPNFQISVNKSPAQFRQPSAGNEEWLEHMQALDLHGQGIVIEITEGLLMGAATDIVNKLFEFRDAGMQVSIDDFGTGYSSLSYLKKFDIDYLKIDQSFVRDLATDPNDMALSEAIVVMAHKLGLKVIAEGVETQEQCLLLSDMGCDYAQGYLFSKAVPAEDLETLLQCCLTEVNAPSFILKDPDPQITQINAD